MLKFVHGVQAKSPIPLDNICSTMRINAIDFDFNDSDDPDEALWCLIEKNVNSLLLDIILDVYLDQKC